MLIKGISRNRDLDPFAAPGDDREDRRFGVSHPHIVLELGHVLFGGPFLGERPRQHEFGLEHRSGLRHDAVEGRTHPADHGMADAALDIPEGLAGIALEPVPVE